MKMGVAFGVSFAIMIFLGWISNELGITQVNITLFTPSEPGGGNFFDNILGPFTWAWESVTGFFQIMTFQANGLPPLVVVALFWPIQIVYVYFVFRMVRGGA